LSKKLHTNTYINTKWLIWALVLFLFISIALSIWIFVEPAQKIDPYGSDLLEVGQSDSIKIPLSEEELSYLKDLEPIRFAVNPDWEPFDMIVNGIHSGIAADLINLIFQRLGITTELVITSNWQESLEVGKEGKVHFLAFLNRSLQREEWLLFTEPYFNDPTAIITRDEHNYVTSLAELEGKTVVLPDGSRFEEQLRNDYPNIRILLVPRVLDVLKAVEKHDADFALHSLTMADYTMRRENVSNLKITGLVPQYENNFRMGIIKQEPMLHSILNKGIATISVLDIQRIKDKYISAPLKSSLHKRLTIGLAIMLTILVGIGLTWIYLLRKMNRYLSTQETALRNSRAMMAYIVEHNASAIAVLDVQLKFIYVSQKYGEVFNISSNLIDRHLYSVHQHVPDYLKDGFREALAGCMAQGAEDSYTRWDGISIWIRWETRPWFLADNTIGGLIFYIEDITDRKDAEAALQGREEKFRLITEHSSDVIWVLNMNSLKFTYISPAVEQLRGFTVEEALQQSLEDSLTPTSFRKVQRSFNGKLEEFLENPQWPQTHYIELQQPCKDGSIIWVEISVKYRLNKKKEVEAVGVSRNIEERKKAEERIRYLSYYDQLTALYNRRYYEEQLPKIDKVENYPLTLVMADVNRLKYVNDNLGHQAGDELLATVADKLRQHSREKDLVARIGGDEYVILMPKTSFRVASELIKVLNTSLQSTKFGSFYLSVAFGWATKESSDTPMADIFKEAEDMMYTRKKLEQAKRT